MNYVTNDQAYGFFSKVSEDFSDINGKIPSNASSGNKMVTASDIATKADLVDGKVPSSQLPSYVDDVLEYASTSQFPATGESGKIYVATDTNKTYRWGGSDYVEISESLALGETSSTAYAGDKGKANADAISDIQDLIPSGATTSNKLATASDIPDTSGLQTKNLSTTIGSYTTVEGALSGINDGKVDKETGKGLSTNDYDATAKGIVDGIPLTIQQLQGSLLNKVDKEVGKGLSTNDYDATAKGIVDNIPLTITQLQGSLLEKFPRSEQAVLGAKNLLDARMKSAELNGVTLTMQSDGSYIANGTCNANSTNFRIDQSTYVGTDNLKTYNGRYTLTLLDVNGEFVNDTRCVMMQNTTWVNALAADSSNNGKATGDVNLSDCFIFIGFSNGVTYNNVRLFPMLRLASDPDDTFAPHAMTNRELTVRDTFRDKTSVITEKGLTFRFIRKGDIVMVVYGGEATEAIANNTKIIDIPNDYTGDFQGLELVAQFRNNINGACCVYTLKESTVYCNSAISAGDKPRGYSIYPH